ncbi:MAG: tetratricopeptide repeat protein, partial [Candidatus Omnitrophica bacterium]|nr:tetratricopeptide repeat protein [Candidatus Omnitrophota bacterium]
VACIKLDRLDDAAKEFKDAIRLDPKNAEVHNNLGVACLRLDRLDDAAKEFKRAIEFNHKCASAYANLGELHLKLGMYDRSARESQKALDLNPKCATAYANFAGIHYKNGNLNEAVKNLRKAVELDPIFTSLSPELKELLNNSQKPKNSYPQKSSSPITDKSSRRVSPIRIALSTIPLILLNGCTISAKGFWITLGAFASVVAIVFVLHYVYLAILRCVTPRKWFERRLKSDKTMTVVSAIEKIGKRGYTKSLEALIVKRLANSSHRINAALGKTIAKLEEDRENARKGYVRALKNTDTRVRKIALEKLNDFGDESVLEPLFDIALNDKEPDNRIFALKVIAKLNDKNNEEANEKVIEMLGKGLQDVEYQVRRVMYEALEESGASRERKVELYMDAIIAKDQPVRADALNELGNIGYIGDKDKKEESLFKHLTERLLNEPEPPVFAIAAAVLAKLLMRSVESKALDRDTATSAVEILIEAWRSRKEPVAVRAVADALREMVAIIKALDIKREDKFSLLISKLLIEIIRLSPNDMAGANEQEQVDLRAAAVKALPEFVDKNNSAEFMALNELLTEALIADPSPDVCAAAAEVSGDTGYKKSTGYLFDKLEKEVEKSLLWAEANRSWRTPRDETAVLPAKVVGIICAEAIGRLGHKGAVSYITQMFDCPDMDIRAAIIKAANDSGATAEEMAVGYIRALKSEDKAVFLSSIYELGGLGVKAKAAVEPLFEIWLAESSIELIIPTGRFLEDSVQGAENLPKRAGMSKGARHEICRIEEVNINSIKDVEDLYKNANASRYPMSEICRLDSLLEVFSVTDTALRKIGVDVEKDMAKLCSRVLSTSQSPKALEAAKRILDEAQQDLKNEELERKKEADLEIKESEQKVNDIKRQIQLLQTSLTDENSAMESAISKFTEEAEHLRQMTDEIRELAGVYKGLLEENKQSAAKILQSAIKQKENLRAQSNARLNEMQTRVIELEEKMAKTKTELEKKNNKELFIAQKHYEELQGEIAPVASSSP